MEGRESGIVCLGNESCGRRGQQRTAETKEKFTWKFNTEPFYVVALANCSSVPSSIFIITNKKNHTRKCTVLS